MNRAFFIATIALVFGVIASGCSQGQSDLPLTVTGHARAIASDVRCSPRDDGVVTISGTLTGTSTTPVNTGVALTATVDWADGRRGKGIWPPVSLRKEQSKPFSLPVSFPLPVIKSRNPNRAPVSSLPHSFPKALRCSVRLGDFKVFDRAGVRV